MDFLTDLREDYEEEDIKTFFALINRRDISRIIEGLTAATKTLRALPEQKRGTSALDPEHLHALFEALVCEAFLEQDKLLQEHFDEPFKLIQSKKPLRIREILPATTRFLFDANPRRLAWAKSIWERIDRHPTELEWNWAMKDFLQSRLQQSSEPQDITRLWSALRVIVGKLDERQITHKLFDLVPNVCTTALNHLAKRSLAPPYIVQTMKMILEKAPDAFWQAMGSISSQTIVEQIFASPNFHKFLQDAADGHRPTDSDVLSWIPTFLHSLKPANRPVACQALVNQLFERVEAAQITLGARKICFEMAAQVILQTIISFSDNEGNRQSVERLVLSDTLNIISHRIDEMLKPKDPDLAHALSERTRTDVLGIVRNALALECQCLKSDYEVLSRKEALGHESSSYSPDLWLAVINNLDEDDVKLSSAALLGIMALPGLEQFRAKDMASMSKEKQSYNAIFEKLTGMVSKILERLSEFKPEHLDCLFKAQDTSMSLIAALFSADQRTYQAAIDLVKNISGESGRKEAVAHLLDAFLGVTVYAICWTFRRISNMKTFASVPRMLKTGMEILDVLCNPTNGKLRRHQLDNRDYGAVQSYWSYQWIALRTVFRQTEAWSLEVHDKPLMTEVCRDAMQYAEALFEQYDLFASVLISTKPDRVNDIPKLLLDSNDSAAGSPLKALDAMSKWLRLRDEYLADTLVKLITKMLYRLKSHNALADSDGLAYVQEVATKSSIKTILSEPQKAMLVRALENYYGKQLERPSHKKQSTLKEWVGSAARVERTSTPVSKHETADEFGDSDIADEDFYELSNQSLDDHQPGRTTGDREAGKTGIKVPPAKVKTPTPTILTAAKKAQDAKAFIENRRREEAARKLREKEAALKLRGKTGVGEHTMGQGSGLTGIGVKGKDHSAGLADSLMVSSESESESDSDEELFGKIQTLPPTVRSQAGIRRPIQPAGPVRKIKQVRSQKDVRARLAPDLSNLHKTILSWDFFAETDLPPNSARDDYTLVTNTFKSPADYQKTFEPLLILEGWQSFRAAREDGTFKPFEVKIASSLLVDNFFEINSQMSFAEGKELSIAVADVVLLSKAKNPATDRNQPHCFARVKEIVRKRGEVQVVYRVNAANNPLRPFLNDKSSVFAIQILSLTPLEREYGALVALPYYDLCEEIIKAKPSPLLEYSDAELQPITQAYHVNMAQAKAVKSALDNDAFTLIQGPPGSGKTKTICALVGAMMTGFLHQPHDDGPRLRAAKSNGAAAVPRAAKKVLVCAPSNAAVDELVMRFKEGVKLMDGSEGKLSVVRLGRSDAISAKVKDVILEELVSARLNAAAPKEAKEDIHSVMMEHKSVSEELVGLRNRVNQQRATGQPVSPEDEQLMDGLKRKKNGLGTKIDDLRERQNTASRDAELSRKRVQQEILDSAHILCATLSGSGHEIFQSLNVEFDTVIIDEAAQSIELSALIPLKYGCSKCVLVGDPKQLPPTVLSRQAAKFQYEQSLFARMENNHKRDVHLLDTQYRMHPEISLFPSRTFYDSRLKDGPGMAQLRARPWHHSNIFAPYRFFDVQGMSQAAAKGHSLINIAELTVAMQLYERLVTDLRQYTFAGKIGVITPYKGQLKELKLRFKQRYGENITSTIEFNTTDAFQGRESEIIIFSCVRASTHGLGFLNDIRRMNVGLTRAKSSLWVLGNSDALMQGEYWRALINDAKERNLYTAGDILDLLKRPLLTEDMMKDDIEMTDVAETDRSPPFRDGSASVRDVSVEASSTPASGVKQGRTPLPPSGRNTPLPSRPNSRSLSRKSSAASSLSSSSISSVARPEPKRQQSSSGLVTSAPRPEGQNRDSPPRTKANQGARSDTSGSETKTGVNGPSGGRFGLNDLAKCAICGSDAHFSPNCDNEQARRASLGGCDRCHQPGHTYSSCRAPRCLECGEVGHIKDECTAPRHLRLTPQQKEEVKRQEIHFGKQRDKAREKRAEKQLGEHGAQIPSVKTTLPPSAPLNAAWSEGKRKREEAGHGSRGKMPKTESNRQQGDTLSVPGKALHGPPINTTGRPAIGPQMVRKKKANADDMFVKRR